MPQSNSTQTTAIPTAVDERTRRTPEAPFMAASMGKGHLAFDLGRRHAVGLGDDSHRGAVKSGNTSTGMRGAV